MPSSILSIRVSRPLADAVRDFAASWGVTTSQLVRETVLYMMVNPDIYAEAIAGPRLAAMQRMDTLSTPEQAKATADYMASLASFSLDDIVAELGHHISPEDGYT